jgi:hypothetical protein
MSTHAEGERRQQRRAELLRQLQEMRRAAAERERERERAAAEREERAAAERERERAAAERERERQTRRRAQQEERERLAMRDTFYTSDSDEYDPYSDDEYLETLNYGGNELKLRI